jgi:hypothetical protein
MGLIDFILNLAGLLLWLNWRSLGLDPLTKATAATLTGTLRRAAPRRLKGWHFLAGLGALLFLRAVLYWQLGSAVNWVPDLQLGVIVLPFRSDFFLRMLLFSALSFVVTLAVFYVWLLLISLANDRVADPDPLQKLMRLHLGRVDRWLWPVKLALPLFVAAILWLLVNVPLSRSNIIPADHSLRLRVEQGIVIGLGAYLTWKFVIGVLFALYIVGSYVYLGNHPVWAFANNTARNLMRPFRWLPLRLGKIDFLPFAIMAFAFAAAEFGGRGLTLLYQRLPL